VTPGLGPAGLRRAQVALAGIFIPFAAWTLLPMLSDVIYRPDVSDFRLYYMGAQLGLSHGWSHLYDPGLQSELLNRRKMEDRLRAQLRPLRLPRDLPQPQPPPQLARDAHPD